MKKVYIPELDKTYDWNDSKGGTEEGFKAYIIKKEGSPEDTIYSAKQVVADITGMPIPKNNEERAKFGEIKNNPWSDRAKNWVGRNMLSGQLETAGMIAGGTAGGLAGIPAGGGVASGATVPLMGLLGAGLGSAGGSSIEDLLRQALGLEGPKTLMKSAVDSAQAGTRGMAGHATGQVMGLAGKKAIGAAGKYLKKDVAPRMMTSMTKDAGLADDMLKRGEWGGYKSLMRKGEEGVHQWGLRLNKELQKIPKVHHKHILNELDELKAYYSKLPDRSAEIAKIDAMIEKVKVAPKGAPDYTNMSGVSSQELKQPIYGEHAAKYKGNKQYDPTSVKNRMDFSIARGLKKGQEAVNPNIQGLNKEMGHSLDLRDTFGQMLDKNQKSEIIPMKPLIAAVMGSGAGPAGAVTAGVAQQASKMPAVLSGGAQLANKLGGAASNYGGRSLTDFALPDIPLNLLPQSMISQIAQLIFGDTEEPPQDVKPKNPTWKKPQPQHGGL